MICITKTQKFRYYHEYCIKYSRLNFSFFHLSVLLVLWWYQLLYNLCSLQICKVNGCVFVSCNHIFILVSANFLFWERTFILTKHLYFSRCRCACYHGHKWSSSWKCSIWRSWCCVRYNCIQCCTYSCAQDSLLSVFRSPSVWSIYCPFVHCFSCICQSARAALAK